jgi:peptidoglycan/LPS O-acetylase OafA/YrhL
MGVARPFDLNDSRPLVAGPQPIVRPSDRAAKLLGLELLRFLSALAVLFFHYQHFARMAGMPVVGRAAQPLYALLWPLYDYGQFGVQIFWGISGFIFFWKYGAAIHARKVAARDFFWLRFSRLYPLHIVTLIGVVALQLIYRRYAGVDFVYPTQDPGTFVKQLLLATDWGPPTQYSFNGPIWSISAEVAVYAGFFLLVRYLAPSARLCIAVIITGLALQLSGVSWASIGCATYFFAGGLAALAPKTATRPTAIAMIVLLTLCAATGMLGDRDKLPIILLVAVPCALILLSRDWRILSHWQRPIQAAGNLTYSSYLLHFPLQLMLAIFVAASGFTPPLTSSLFLIGYLGITFAAAALSYRMFELPAQQWLRKRTLARAA